MKVFVGVDCGATNLRVGVADEKGKLIGSSKVPSPLKSRSLNFAHTISEQAKLLIPGETWEPIALGIGVPGPLDLKNGMILPSANLGNLNPIDLINQFDAEFNAPTYFDRDTNLALIGESWCGLATNTKDAAMITLGSGVGGSILINGRIIRGVSGKGGEIGHMVLWMEVPPMEKLKQSLVCIGGKNWGNEPTTLPRPTVSSKSNSVTFHCGLGHENCLEALINSAKNMEETGIYLGFGLANIVNIFNPELIIVGGGKMNLGDFLPNAVCVMKEVGMRPAVDEVEVGYAKLGELSGVYGGIRLAMEGTND